jgi:hypothetical protein
MKGRVVGMHPKIELYRELSKIAHEILDEIVSPACGIPKGSIWADLWLADLECYCMEDDEAREKILTGIEERYNLKENELGYIDTYTPLIQIALFLYLRDRKDPADASTTERTH